MYIITYKSNNNNNNNNKNKNNNNEISFGGIPNGRKILFLQIFLKRAGKPGAGNTSADFP